MRLRLRKLAVILGIAALLVGLTSTNMKIAFSEGAGGNIDLFTQKEPYSGKGSNIQSDAFGPGEEVQINALVTYNEQPLQNYLVAFEILGPANSAENITLHRVLSTDGAGIATTSVRISVLNETTFGEWTAIGNVKIADLTFQDTVKFKVGWIVEIISVRTINEDYLNQDSFMREGYVGIDVVLRNIAMTEKIATLTITIYDYLNVYVDSTELKDFTVPPNSIPIHTYFSLYIPKTANVGNATVYACAYTASVPSGGVAYCPEVLASFLIVPREYSLTIITTAGGTTNPAPGTYTYTSGSAVQVTATPNSYYILDHWELDGVNVGSANITLVYMDRNHTLKAVFSLTPAGWFVPYWVFWVFIPLILLTAVLLIALLYRRRRKKKDAEAFYSGWTAWYYSYDLRKKSR
jgi:hypothetical protein